MVRKLYLRKSECLKSQVLILNPTKFTELQVKSEDEFIFQFTFKTAQSTVIFAQNCNSFENLPTT